MSAYFDLLQVPQPQNLDMVLNEARDGAIRNVQGNLLNEKELVVGDYRARQIVVQVPGNGLLDSQFLIVGRRVYVLSVLNMKAKNTAEVERFFNSLHLMQ
jgi:hypothetical protein